jgi:hypothetical protein
MNKKNSKKQTAPLAGLKKATENEHREMIRALLALPMNKRTHFLRVRHPNGGSHL